MRCFSSGMRILLAGMSIHGKRIVCPVNETASPTATAYPQTPTD